MMNIDLPPVLFGTSGLGNLYAVLSNADKKDIVAECIRHSKKPAVFDSAGKYGAGLALESLGKSLRELETPPEEVLISNKLGWLRTELLTREPTFEPGVWHGLQYDARQSISYDGMLECFEQGNTLLNGYQAQLISVHDPDEYLAGASDSADQRQRYRDILAAYDALSELKSSGKVSAIGIGAKDWRVIERLSNDVQLDWVMLANSMTIYSHPCELVVFMNKLEQAGIAIINSAVFNGGFLTGSDYYNYQPVDPENHAALYRWRNAFNELCLVYKLRPAEVAAYFGLKAPGVKSIALNTTNPERVADNIAMAAVKIPPEFWKAMRARGLIDETYPDKYLKN